MRFPSPFSSRFLLFLLFVYSFCLFLVLPKVFPSRLSVSVFLFFLVCWYFLVCLSFFSSFSFLFFPQLPMEQQVKCDTGTMGLQRKQEEVLNKLNADEKGLSAFFCSPSFTFLSSGLICPSSTAHLLCFSFVVFPLIVCCSLLFTLLFVFASSS